MSREFCPHCGVVRNMEATSSRRRVVDSDGRVKYVRAVVMHCETCGAFVRSEEWECPKDGAEGA